jgi:hypothetical protein
MRHFLNDHLKGHIWVWAKVRSSLKSLLRAYFWTISLLGSLKVANSDNFKFSTGTSGRFEMRSNASFPHCVAATRQRVIGYLPEVSVLIYYFMEYVPPVEFL